ncbi:RagB/SusD family nutrient uptake outer membrane protein [Chitinophaga pendula]|uniref:RagB/SusD family nutrient uptake outer membrane protein n=1 Tax=Chitinophaga TaxID=79328 RepID=UPI000BB04FD0|nr:MULTISPECIES: RagB/SusD family nutrient uptake outer membrane protein [Chitinophaga]ASZ13442.1 hypothetical protein CK934_22020 [Chitinophaga sp. MD30]UCJ08932.1 RagB/SusD family nutrient uptake outer membrane protein [Chitinophaga pendula]
MRIAIVAVWLLLCVGCRDKFLDVKPDSNIINPSTVEDLQNLLDNTGTVNRSPSLGTISADEYYYADEATFLSAPAPERNAYIWAANIYTSPEGVDWSIPYKQIFIANTVLDIIRSIPDTEKDLREGKLVRGHAYFVRGFAFFNLLTTFSKAYNATTASTDLGIPLKLSPIVENIEQRSSVEDSYRQVFSDLQTAIRLLPDDRPTQYRNRPSKSAVYALLSRICISMRRYDDALLYSDSCLSLYDQLIDYNTLNPNINVPFSPVNDENMCSYTQLSYNTMLSYTGYYKIKIDSNIYNAYDGNDLRKNIFYKIDPISKKPSLKVGMGGGLTPYSGLATDEVLLNKAECLARKNRNEEALAIINKLLSKRYKSGTFIPIPLPGNMLELVFSERKKELVFRGTRWTDIKRLNLESAPITLRRKVGTQNYTLQPNSPLYILPIPEGEITTTGIKQNER